MVDDGGDATLLIHKGYELENGSDWVHSASSSHEEDVIKVLLKRVHKERPSYWRTVVQDWRGVSEETTTGVHRLSPSPSSTTSTVAANRWRTALSAPLM